MSVQTIINEILGEEADVSRISDTLRAEKVGGESYTEETFKSHLEAVKSKGESYLDFLDDLRVKPGMSSMFAFIISQGPEGVYGLLETMGGLGLLDKTRVRSAAKITTAREQTERAWFRQIWDELATDAYSYLEERFETRREEFQKSFPEVSSVANFMALLKACGKSTLNSGVGYIDVPQTGKKTSVALGFRIDAHSPKRNGGWDASANDGAGSLTKDYYDAKEKAATSALPAPAPAPDDDDADPDSE